MNARRLLQGFGWQERGSEGSSLTTDTRGIKCQKIFGED